MLFLQLFALMCLVHAVVSDGVIQYTLPFILGNEACTRRCREHSHCVDVFFDTERLRCSLDFQVKLVGEKSYTVSTCDKKRTNEGIIAVERSFLRRSGYLTTRLVNYKAISDVHFAVKWHQKCNLHFVTSVSTVSGQRSEKTPACSSKKKHSCSGTNAKLLSKKRLYTWTMMVIADTSKQAFTRVSIVLRSPEDEAVGGFYVKANPRESRFEIGGWDFKDTVSIRANTGNASMTTFLKVFLDIQLQKMTISDLYTNETVLKIGMKTNEPTMYSLEFTISKRCSFKLEFDIKEDR